MDPKIEKLVCVYTFISFILEFDLLASIYVFSSLFYILQL